MRTITAGLIILLTLAACQPVDINPALEPDAPVVTREPEPVVDEPETTPVVDTPSETPILDPSTFNLPKYLTFSFGRHASGCSAKSYLHTSTQLMRIICYTPYPSYNPGASIPAEAGVLIRAHLSSQGLVEDEHYELDSAFPDRIVIYILDSTYTGLTTP